MTERIDRRRFLIGAGTALAGAALACGRQRVVPTTAPTPVPTLTPLPTPTEPPTPTPTALIKPTAPPERAADLALLNGKVITVDPDDTIAEAVAVRDGLIQAVGAGDEVAALIGEATEVVDLGGRAVTPGLIAASTSWTAASLAAID